MKRFVTCLLALVLLTSTLLFTVSCGGGEENEDTLNLGEISTDADGLRYDENGYLMDDLPEDLNFGGTDVNIFTCTEFATEMCPTEFNNTALNDASYTRNKIIEGRLGIKLNFVLEYGVPTATGIYEAFTSKMTNAVNAGTGDFDAVAGFSLGPASWAMNGYTLNLKDIKYLDFEKPWWSYSVLENAFYDSIYYASTNCSGSVLSEMTVTYYNRQMLAENGIADPESLALEGKWTIDKLFQYAKGLGKDTNPNEQEDFDDTFGLVFRHAVFTDSLFYGTGFNLTRNNPNTGLPEFTLYDKGEMERAVDLIKSIISAVATRDVTLTKNPGEGDAAVKIMSENRTALYISYLKDVSAIPDSKIWGIIPTPKLDESQENYITTPNNDFDMWCIPKDAKNPDMTGAIMEAYASGCYRTVAPAYYDENLSYRYSNNENGVKIFAEIRQNVKLDFGRLNSFAIGTIDEIIRDAYRKENNTFSQSWVSNQKSYKKMLNKVIESYNVGE